MTGYCTVDGVWYTTLEAYEWHLEHCRPQRAWCRRHQSYQCDCHRTGTDSTRHGGHPETSRP